MRALVDSDARGRSTPSVMIMVTSDKPVIIRGYEDTDYALVVDLFIRIKRELARAKMRELFERYIQPSINGQMCRSRDIFSETRVPLQDGRGSIAGVPVAAELNDAVTRDASPARSHPGR